MGILPKCLKLIQAGLLWPLMVPVVMELHVSSAGVCKCPVRGQYQARFLGVSDGVDAVLSAL